MCKWWAGNENYNRKRKLWVWLHSRFKANQLFICTLCTRCWHEFDFLQFKPSLSMKILSINNFTIKLLSDLSIGVQLKRIFDTKKFSSKVDNRQYLIWKTVFLWKSCLIITLLPVFLVPFKWSLRRLLKCLVKSLIDNIFKERLGFSLK